MPNTSAKNKPLLKQIYSVVTTDAVPLSRCPSISLAPFSVSPIKPFTGDGTSVTLNDTTVSVNG